jgi:Txe/YoeB family toxin of Txe-Axe toxin-antitoxin module
VRSKVVFADRKLKEAFERLKDSTAEDRKLYKWLNKAFDDIASDTFRGTQIPKRLIPGKYIERYGIENLWKYNLPGAWRLLYSVARDEVVIVSIILEWLPHKDYERRFNY